jgi:hypothetical protein
MAAVPILAGINANLSAEWTISYPRNMVPTALDTGISNGYLKTVDGLEEFVTIDESFLGSDRGGINWNGELYHVIGQYFLKVDDEGNYTIIDTLPLGGNVRFDFSFDYLGIAASDNLYLYDGVTVQQVTDPDLREVFDMLWVDGYFMTTDGKYIVVTDIDDPFSVNPLKYGALQNDPSPIQALLKVKDEAYALSRYTISPLSNVGGTGFPFEVIKGGVIQKGIVGRRAACVYLETIAFLGSGRNEAIAVYLVNAGVAQKISTVEIDRVLSGYSEANLANVLMETRVHDDMQQLYIHLPDQTMVYDIYVSGKLGFPVWYFLSSSHDAQGLYRARNFVYVYDKWTCGDVLDARRIGYLTREHSAQYGNAIGYQFDTPIVYGDGKNVIVHEMELVATTGRNYDDDFTEQYIRRQYSLDGINWSDAMHKSLGAVGNFQKRVRWMKCGMLRNWRIERFRGLTKHSLGVARLECLFEKLQ